MILLIMRIRFNCGVHDWCVPGKQGVIREAGESELVVVPIGQAFCASLGVLYAGIFISVGSL